MDNYSAPASGNGFGSEEDPAAAFLAQQENEIAGIENDEGYGISNGGQVQSSFGKNAPGDRGIATKLCDPTTRRRMNVVNGRNKTAYGFMIKAMAAG